MQQRASVASTAAHGGTVQPGGHPGLIAIPVIETGPDFALETLAKAEARIRALLDAATAHAPASALRIGDAISRRWLLRSRNPYLAEIDAVAARLRRPGAYFFAINYEWGCTVKVGPCPDRAAARLVRVLDWRTPGLGRNIVVARVEGHAAGPFLVPTWPGYTGVLQGMAPGRFAAALNQAPMRRSGGGFYAVDWAANKARVWSLDHTTPAHLLRHVFETAQSFRDARRMLVETPIAAPAIFSLSGLRASETAIIERDETEARVQEGTHAAANHWQAPGWHGRPRGEDSIGRVRDMLAVEPSLQPAFDWLRPPVLNPRTRLAMVASAAERQMVVQGFEADGPATEVLQLAA